VGWLLRKPGAARAGLLLRPFTREALNLGADDAADARVLVHPQLNFVLGADLALHAGARTNDHARGLVVAPAPAPAAGFANDQITIDARVALQPDFAVGRRDVIADFAVDQQNVTAAGIDLAADLDAVQG
jgi:hypothetical protein